MCRFDESRRVRGVIIIAEGKAKPSVNDAIWPLFRQRYSKLVHEASCKIGAASGATGSVAYVGVTGDLRGRWYGSERIPPQHAHGNNWEYLHVLSHYALNAGQFERDMISILRKEFGEQSLANIHPGGGGIRASEPNFLYICVLPRRSWNRG